MGSRCGDLDPGVVLHLLRDGRRTVEDVDHLLNRESGLAGLSGLGNDLRDIEDAAARGDDAARLAVVVYAHRVKKYIGAYAAAMGGADAVILTGGIGENGAAMRRRILQRLDFLGLLIDEDANADARVSRDHPVADISQPHARTRALVVATNEELEIARQTAAVAGGATTVRRKGAIPIAVSAHHLHLCERTFKRLFGADAALTKHKDLSQPGQYASEQRVSLVGPRGRVERVRILGPLRAVDQVEVSRTDEFRLGVDAPIRRSGQVEGSAPITLEGPAGRVDLPEGLICAWRHIHMTPQDAERLGVENGDQVEVAVTGGPRDLTFGDVLVRVSAKYALEMHIDTDEANAAELAPRDQGDIVYASPCAPVTAEVRSKRDRG
jgi:acetate kinase